LKIEIGKTYYPHKRELLLRENLVKGNWWKAEKIENRYIFEFLVARHCGGTDSFEISEDEFLQLKTQELSASVLIEKYDVF
jgi:hypothetical protein